jgi:hypothetical protein
MGLLGWRRKRKVQMSPNFRPSSSGSVATLAAMRSLRRESAIWSLTVESIKPFYPVAWGIVMRFRFGLVAIALVINLFGAAHSAPGGFFYFARTLCGEPRLTCPGIYLGL